MAVHGFMLSCWGSRQPRVFVGRPLQHHCRRLSFVPETTESGVAQTKMLSRASNLGLLVLLLLLPACRPASHGSPTDQKTLREAAMGGDLDTVKKVLSEVEKGFDVDAADPGSGSTALMLAAGNGHYEIMKLLLENGAYHGMDDTDGRYPIHVAAWQGHLENVKYLVEKGARITVTTKEKFTPLMLAAMAGQIEVCRWLLDNGAEVDAVGPDGYTALMLAAAKEKAHTTKLLIDYGADLKHVADDGHHAQLLMEAAVKREKQRNNRVESEQRKARKQQAELNKQDM